MEYFKHTMIVGAKIKDDMVVVKDVFGDIREFVNEDVIPVLNELDSTFFNDEFNSKILSESFIRNNYESNLKEVALILKGIIDKKQEEQNNIKSIMPMPYTEIDEFDF